MIKEVPDRKFCWPDVFLSKICGKTFLRSEAPYRWFWGLHIENRIWKSEKKMLFSYKIRLSRCISGQITVKIWKIKISKMVFRKKGIKSRWGGPRSKFLVSLNFFIEILWKKIFGVGDPKNRRIWGFFQKSMSEISANWEKTCFSCCRFFRKIEEMRVYFGGCALIFFSQKLINIAGLVCKN